LSEEVQTIFWDRDLAVWGWLWLLVGIVLIAAGVALATGAEWARWVGILAAGIQGFLSFTWIYFQPLWSTLSVTLAILVIYALCTYGGRWGPKSIDRA
jgi:hypothetical protein